MMAMTIDYVKMGIIRAEFEAACRAIDRRAKQASKEALKGAWTSLLADDLEERDRFCEKVETVEIAVLKAKKEVYLRIAEKHGYDRDIVEASMDTEFKARASRSN